MLSEDWFWNTDAAFITWCIFLIIGTILFLFGLYVFLFRKDNRNRIVIAAASEFAAYWLMFIPFEFCREFDGNDLLLHSIHSALIAFLKSFTKYLGDGYEGVYYPGHPYFSMFYGGMHALVNIVMLLFMAGFIIKFIDGPINRIKLLTNKNKYLYVFSEYNDKTAAIAKTLPKDKPGIIIFAGSEDELSEEKKHKIEELGAIVIYEELKLIIRKYKKNAKGIEVFLFDDLEQNNLSDLGNITDEMTNTPVISKIYVEINKTPCDVYNEYLVSYDSENTDENARTVINFVREEETYVYNNLLHNSIFNNARINASGDKEIKILIVGVNDRNIEFLKTVLFLSQMPGFRPTIVVVDEDDRPDLIRTIIPEIKDEIDVKGDAIYKYIYCGGVSINSLKFEELIRKEHSDFTFAYVNVGTDLININTALRINSFCKRLERNDGYKIQVSVSDSSVCEQWDKEMLDGIQVTGEISEVYSYSFITMSDIERLSKKIHEVRQADKVAKVKEEAVRANEAARKAQERYESLQKQKGKNRKELEAAKKEAEEAADKADKTQKKADNAHVTPWEDYYNNEYNRHSVYARTLSFRHKVRYILEQGLEPSVSSQIDPWLIYEHMRWNMYTRTQGYVRPDEHLEKVLKELNEKIRLEADKKTIKDLKRQRQLIRSTAKVHEDLVHFDELPPKVREQDGLKLTKEIVEAFEEEPLE